MIKRVLLLGDCSAVHKNLCDGLRNIGIDAVDASYGNAWRQLDSSINFAKKIYGLPQKISENISPFLYLNKLADYDVVQFIQYANNFNPRFGIDRFLSRKIAKSSGKVFLVSTGCDPYIRKYYTNGAYEFPELCSECLTKDRKTDFCYLDSKSEIGRIEEFLELVDGVIPLIYEYAEAHRQAGNPKLKATIPIPVNTDKVQYTENTVGSKIVFFHGVNRVGFKGTDLFRSALENVRSRYPNDIEVIIDGRMSLDKYLAILKRTNVILDQTYALTYGLNAVYSMALGKVVVGGGHRKGLEEYGVTDSPMIPVYPNLKSIEESIERLIECKKDIPRIGVASRRYVEEVHHYELVAREFLRAWESR